MKKIFSTLILICLFVQAMAQDVRRNVRGTVRDANGAIPGVTIFEKDVPGNGTTTTETGTFNLSVRGKSNILVFKFVGYLCPSLERGIMEKSTSPAKAKSTLRCSKM
ncbi:carboxypeptidase-like regulatory domain-containing protein [Chitinophaga sp.]|uniref:carboxypeptidase-like regulatory domain-containing protein n=1 Tax=Chitinophaga sp. TaxID=1869181 RepID=UPI0026034BDF|nr:carboxypeptidase-like regulatory domain-containing protein [uncultured Chitinophaga sp.]